MLSNIIGPVDINAAFVLVAAFVSACIVATALIAKRRSRLVIANEFELAKLKQDGENARLLYSVETDRAYKFKQIDQGVITSHVRHES